MAAEDISNFGERVNAEAGDFTYYGHLSVYSFAAPYCRDKRVLDAGCGAGYGSAFLARSGAKSVAACDASADAIAFCKRRYASEEVDFRTVDLCATLPYQDTSFDVIFSSNVMEHLYDIDGFLNECRRIIQNGGIMIIAVPPITSVLLLEVNLRNGFHVTNLTPLGWFTKISRFFGNVKCFQHKPSGIFSDPSVFDMEQKKPANELIMRERDFAFPAATIEELNSQEFSLAAIFIASAPRSEVLPPSLDEHIPYHWYYGVVISKVIREEQQKILSSRMPTTIDAAASQETVPLRAQSAETVRSKAWRPSTPFRSIAAIVRRLR